MDIAEKLEIIKAFIELLNESGKEAWDNVIQYLYDIESMGTTELCAEVLLLMEMPNV